MLRAEPSRAATKCQTLSCRVRVSWAVRAPGLGGPADYPSAFRDDRFGHPKRSDCCLNGPIEGPLSKELTALVDEDVRCKSPLLDFEAFNNE